MQSGKLGISEWLIYSSVVSAIRIQVIADKGLDFQNKMLDVLFITCSGNEVGKI